jgi:predicted 3-demethylubiquinone-9 3-methyltransferase (glyoxalase superfamily)
MNPFIYPCLWFDNQAKEAAEFYCSIFPNSKIIFESPMVVQCELNGHRFMGLNGGPQFKHTEATSFVIECKDQQEIDHYWNNLIADGGQESRCGWCKDKFGVSWQVVPKALPELMLYSERSEKVFTALMAMEKIDLQTLLNA